MGRSNISSVLNDFIKRKIRTNNIGLYPFMGEKEGLEVAMPLTRRLIMVREYGTMKVADRIKSMTAR
jgi:hypothetical protein